MEERTGEVKKKKNFAMIVHSRLVRSKRRRKKKKKKKGGKSFVPGCTGITTPRRKGEAGPKDLGTLKRRRGEEKHSVAAAQKGAEERSDETN